MKITVDSNVFSSEMFFFYKKIFLYEQNWTAVFSFSRLGGGIQVPELEMFPIEMTIFLLLACIMLKVG